MFQGPYSQPQTDTQPDFLLNYPEPNLAGEDYGRAASSGEAETPISATTAPAATSSESELTKGKRRVVHPAFGSLRACDSCRSKRVKCVRLLADDPTCEYCRNKWLVCTTKFNGGVRYKPRAKKEAPTTQQNLDTFTAATVDSFLNATSSAMLAARSDLSPTSAENRLSLTEESETLMGHLMDGSVNSFLGPTGMWMHLRDSFASVGRRPNMLDPVSEIVATACMALGALQSDHPLIIGSGSPRIRNLKSASAAADLSCYARRRATLCQQLADRAISLVDARGLFRKPELQSVTTLVLMHRMVTHMAGGDTDLVKPYLSANVSLVQQLRDTKDPPTVMLNAMSVLIWTQDSIRSAFTGAPFHLPEDDVSAFLCFDESEIPNFTINQLHNITDATSADPPTFMAVIGLFWNPTVRQFRRLAAEICIPLRRKASLNAEDFARHLEEAESMIETYKAASEVASRLRPLLTPSTADLQTKILGMPILSVIETIPLLACPLLLALSQQFETWSLTRSVFSAENPGPMEELVEMATIRRKLSRMMVDAVLLLADGLEKNTDSVYSWPKILNWYGVQYALGAWANIALSAECADAGDPSKYTTTVKLRTCRTLIDAVRVQTWIWAHRHDDVAHLESRFQQVLMEINTGLEMPVGRSEAIGIAASMSAPDHAFTASSGGPPVSNWPPRQTPTPLGSGEPCNFSLGGPFPLPALAYPTPPHQDWQDF